MPGTTAARQLSVPRRLTSISTSMSSGDVSHDTPPRTGAEALLTSTSASSEPSALSTASRWEMSSAIGRQPVSCASASEILGRAGDGIDVEAADPELADDRRADAAARAGNDGGAIAIERHGFLLCPARTAA